MEFFIIILAVALLIALSVYVVKTESPPPQFTFMDKDYQAYKKSKSDKTYKKD